MRSAAPAASGSRRCARPVCSCLLARQPRCPAAGWRRRSPASPTVQESRSASWREKPRALAAANVAPLRDTPGDQRQRLGATPRREPIAHVGACRRRSLRVALLPKWRCPRARAGGMPLFVDLGARPSRPIRPAAVGDLGRRAEPPLDLSAERVAGQRRRRQAAAKQPSFAPVLLGTLAMSEPCSPPATLSSRSHGSRRSRAAAVPACSATSKDLRSLGSSSLVRPAGQPRDERGVRRRGDRQQLGRAVQQAEDDRVAQVAARARSPASRRCSTDVGRGLALLGRGAGGRERRRMTA